MASTVTQIAEAVDTTSPWTTGSISTFTSGRRALVAVYSFVSGGTAPGDGGRTLTGNGQTWTSLGSGTHTDGNTFSARLELWTCLLSSPTTDVITAAFTTTQPNEVFFKVAECSEAGNVVQTSTVNSGASTSPSSTLSAFADTTNNVCYTAIAAAQGGTSISFEASLTELGADLTGGANGNRFAHAWQTGENTTVSGTLGSSIDWIAISVEIDNDPGSSGTAISGEATTSTFSTLVDDYIIYISGNHDLSWGSTVDATAIAQAILSGEASWGAESTSTSISNFISATLEWGVEAAATVSNVLATAVDAIVEKGTTFIKTGVSFIRKGIDFIRKP